MKIIDRYILRVFGGALFVATVFLVGLYLIIHILTHIRYHEKATISFAEADETLFGGLCHYYAIHLPEILTLFGPYALFVAAMYAVHHLNQSNELVPLYAVGVSRLRVAAPLFVATAAVSLVLMGLREEVIPSLAREMLVVTRQSRGMDDPIYNHVDLIRDTRGNVFFARQWDGGRRRLNEVFMQSPGRSKPYAFEYLQWVGDLEDGQFEPPTDAEANAATFRQLSDLSPFDVEYEERLTRRLSFRQLRELTLRKPEKRNLAVLMHDHITYPFTPLVLLLIGLPLVMRGRRRNVFAGLAVCIVMSLAFFSVSLLLQRMGSQETLVNPLLGAWLPLIMFGSLGLILFELPE